MGIEFGVLDSQSDLDALVPRRRCPSPTHSRHRHLRRRNVLQNGTKQQWPTTPYLIVRWSLSVLSFVLCVLFGGVLLFCAVFLDFPFCLPFPGFPSPVPGG